MKLTSPFNLRENVEFAILAKIPKISRENKNIGNPENLV